MIVQDDPAPVEIVLPGDAAGKVPLGEEMPDESSGAPDLGDRRKWIEALQTQILIPE